MLQRSHRLGGHRNNQAILGESLLFDPDPISRDGGQILSDICVRFVRGATGTQ